MAPRNFRLAPTILAVELSLLILMWQILLHANITAVPEPSTSALLGLGGKHSDPSIVTLPPQMPREPFLAMGAQETSYDASVAEPARCTSTIFGQALEPKTSLLTFSDDRRG